MTASQRLRARRAALGLCINCKNPSLPNKRQCEFHRKASRDKATRHYYKISQEELDKLRLATNCALCGGLFSGTVLQPLAPVIDHNHSTGKIRGVVHQKCNIAIGMFNENISMLQSAIIYLQGECHVSLNC